LLEEPRGEAALGDFGGVTGLWADLGDAAVSAGGGVRVLLRAVGCGSSLSETVKSTSGDGCGTEGWAVFEESPTFGKALACGRRIRITRGDA
jgi:hypothetical protein